MVVRVMKCTTVSENPMWTTYHVELLYVLSHLILLGKWLYLHFINDKTKGKRVKVICTQLVNEKS